MSLASRAFFPKKNPVIFGAQEEENSSLDCIKTKRHVVCLWRRVAPLSAGTRWAIVSLQAGRNVYLFTRSIACRRATVNRAAHYTLRQIGVEAIFTNIPRSDTLLEPKKTWCRKDRSSFSSFRLWRRCSQLFGRVEWSRRLSRSHHSRYENLCTQMITLCLARVS